jgi:DNA-binding transcriptional ArsR family regulator
MPTDTLHSTFRALADPTRRAILARLASGGEASVKELAEPFQMTLPAVSKHLKVLERAGLISRGREAQSRPCRLEAGPLRSTASTCTTSAMGTALLSCCSMESCFAGLLPELACYGRQDPHDNGPERIPERRASRRAPGRLAERIRALSRRSRNEPPR